MRCPSRVVQAIALIAGVAVAPSGWAATADEAQATIEPYALGGVSVRSIGVSPSFAEDHALFAGEAFRRVVYRLEGPIVSNSSELISTSSITEIALTPDYRQHGGGGGASGATGVVFAGGFTGGPRSPWVHRSEDGGATWVPSFHSDGIPGTRDISVSPDFVRDRTVFLATNAGLAKSTDGGATFIPHNGGLPFTNTSVVAVSPAYGTDRTVFTGLQGTGEGVFKSVDGGDTWSPSGAGLPPSTSYPGTDVTDLVLSPAYATDRTLFVSVDSNGVYRSTDGGATWNEVFDLPDLHFGFLAVSPEFATDGSLFATRGGRVYLSRDRGEAWSDLGELLGINDLDVSPDYARDHTLFAATDTGVYRVVVPEPCGILLLTTGMAAYLLSRRRRGSP